VALEGLEELATAIAGRIKRKASVSAVVRALIRRAQQTPDPDLVGTLVKHIEEEHANELVWGKPRAR
jgi:hypothetical protein